MSKEEPSAARSEEALTQCFPDTRVPIALLHEHVAQGFGVEEFMAMYPRVQRRDIELALRDRSAMLTVSVLFLDIVGSARLSPPELIQVCELLNTVVRETRSYQEADLSARLICRPVGDGMAIAFFDGVERPFSCALEITEALRYHPTLRLRMGIHVGPAHIIRDINGNDDVTGDAMITAKRVMDVGDPGHILLSNAAAEALQGVPSFASMIRMLGVAEVKHGVRVAVWSVIAPGVGNPRPPKAIVDSIVGEYSPHMKEAARRTRGGVWVLGSFVLGLLAIQLLRSLKVLTPVASIVMWSVCVAGILITGVVILAGRR